MRQLLKVAVITLTVCYPFIIYWGLQHCDARFLLPVLLLLLGLRWLKGNKVFERSVVVATIVGMIIIGLVWGQTLSLKFYPVLVNAGFLALFASSLVSPPTVVERLARLREPELSAAGVVYTRKVTWTWSIFFIINGSIAAITAVWASNEIWTLYNGFIAYLLIGALAGSEWLIRKRMKRD